MKNLIFLIFSIFTYSSLVAQDDDEGNNPPPRYTMFSVEAAHGYNDIVAKHAFQAKFYLWADLASNFGFETHVYFPRENDKNFDFQIDLNYRRILVDFHPVFFDILVGPGVRYGQMIEGTRGWNFDGINIGFGFGYRYKNISIYTMPRITHTDPRLQITSGVKYHFNSESRYFFKNRYKLRKKSVN